MDKPGTRCWWYVVRDHRLFFTLSICYCVIINIYCVHWTRHIMYICTICWNVWNWKKKTSLFYEIRDVGRKSTKWSRLLASCERIEKTPLLKSRHFGSISGKLGLSQLYFLFYTWADFFPHFFLTMKMTSKIHKKISELCGLERHNLCIYKTIRQKSDKMNHPSRPAPSIQMSVRPSVCLSITEVLILTTKIFFRFFSNKARKVMKSDFWRKKTWRPK